MNNKITIIIVAVLLVGGSFYAGMKYSSLGRGGSMMRANFNRGTQVARIGSALGQKGIMFGNGMVAGEIITKDDKSIVVKLNDGGSRILFFSPSTQITRSIKGGPEDIIVGEKISVFGEQNSDGSIIARSLQIGNIK